MVNDNKRTMSLDIVELLEYGIKNKVNQSFIIREAEGINAIDEKLIFSNYLLSTLVLKVVDYSLTTCKNNDKYKFILEDSLGNRYSSINYLKDDLKINIGDHLVGLGGLFQKSNSKILRLPYGFYIDNKTELTQMTNSIGMLDEEILGYEVFYNKENLKYLLYKDDEFVEPMIVEYSEKSSGGLRSNKPNPHNKDNSKRSPESDASKLYVVGDKEDGSSNLFKILNIFLDGPLSKGFITQSQLTVIIDRFNKLGYKNIKLVRAKKVISNEEHAAIYEDLNKGSKKETRLYKKVFYNIDNHFNDLNEPYLYMKTRKTIKRKKIFGVITIPRDIIKGG